MIFDDTGHLDAGTLHRFGERTLDRVELFEAAWHLFTCAACRARLPESGPDAEAVYRAMFDGLEAIDLDAHSDDLAPWVEKLRLLGRRVEQERHLAPGLYEELAGRSLTRQLLMVETDGRFHLLGLAEHVIAECRDGWSDDPGRSEGLAELALAVVAHLPLDVYDPKLVADTKAEGWSCIANCRRIRSGLKEAAEAFEIAEGHRIQGSGDPMEEAALLDLRASLLRDQHRITEAREALERAITLYREANDDHLAGRALINLATLDRRQGRIDQAIETLLEAGGLIDTSREPRLIFMLRKNLALFLSEADRAEEAAEMLPELRRLAADRVGSLETLRLRWTEGLIYRRLGQDSWAENSLRRARDGFLESGIGYESVLVSLDLAALYLDANRRREARLLAAEMISAFTTRDLHREAIVAVAMFARAAWEEQVTHELVDRVTGYLHEARHNPALRFEHVH